MCSAFNVPEPELAAVRTDVAETDGNGLLDLVCRLLSIPRSPCSKRDAGYRSAWEHARQLSSAYTTFLDTRLAVVKLDFAPGHNWELGCKMGNDVEERERHERIRVIRLPRLRSNLS